MGTDLYKELCKTLPNKSIEVIQNSTHAPTKAVATLTPTHGLTWLMTTINQEEKVRLSFQNVGNTRRGHDCMLISNGRIVLISVKSMNI